MCVHVCAYVCVKCSFRNQHKDQRGTKAGCCATQDYRARPAWGRELTYQGPKDAARMVHDVACGDSPTS